MSLWIEWNIQFTWKFAWMLRTYRTCNSTIGFSKYEFYNKLLGGVTLLRIIPDVTWIQPIYIYIYINTYTHTYIRTRIYYMRNLDFFFFFLLIYLLFKRNYSTWKHNSDANYRVNNHMNFEIGSSIGMGQSFGVRVWLMDVLRAFVNVLKVLIPL